MNASEEGVVFHRDGLITDANPAASRLFETPLDQLLGPFRIDIGRSDLRFYPRHCFRPHARVESLGRRCFDGSCGRYLGDRFQNRRDFHRGQQYDPAERFAHSQPLSRLPIGRRTVAI